MWCLAEHKPVAAKKSLFRSWHCPDCGGKVAHAKSFLARRDRKRNLAA
jgi:hypothetical protein